MARSCLISCLRERGPGHRLPYGEGIAPHLPAGAVRWFASGRAALFRALRAAGIHSGDVVHMPAYVAAGVIEPVRALGAGVCFYETGCGLIVDPERVVAGLDRRSRAVVVIHPFGLPQPAAKLAIACRARRVLLVEDCAQALFCRHGDGRPYGSDGDIALFSLTKLLPLDDGAAVVVRDPALVPPQPSRRARLAQIARRGFAVHLRAVWRMHRGLAGPQAAGRTYDRHYAALSRDLSASVPCRATREAIGRLGAGWVISRRRANALRVCAGLHCRRLRIVGDWRPVGRVPMALPALVEGEPRDLFAARALAAGVLLASLIDRWDYLPATDGFVHERDWIARHVLLPVNENLPGRAIDAMLDRLNGL